MEVKAAQQALDIILGFGSARGLDSSPLFCRGSGMVLYLCLMKTHHSSDALSCGLSKAVQNYSIYILYLGQMQCFRTKCLIPLPR